jgi:hypothetical protein
MMKQENVNIKKNITKLWCKIVLQINVEQIEGHALFIVLWGISSKKLPWKFSCVRSLTNVL